MTIIVGFLSDKRMYIGGDRLGSNGHTKKQVNKPKVFKKGKMLFGYTTSFRFGQIIEEYFEPPKDIRKTPYQYMIRDVVPEIRKVLEEHKYSASDHAGESGVMIICYGGFVYKLQGDWSILEYSDFYAIGSGEEVAYGAVHALNRVDGISPKKKIEMAIEASYDRIVSVGGEIDVLSVKVE